MFGLNDRAAKSVESIMQKVLHKPPDSLLYFAIFGSQVRGEEQEDSDLDTFFVVRKSTQSCLLEVSRAATVEGGVEDVTIIPHVPETLLDVVNVYGTVE